MAKLWQFRQGHPKPAFSEKVQRGDQKKFFKHRPKSSPHLKGPTGLWPTWHYPLISIQLKCKDWRKFWRKKQLQKCPNGQGMAIFARSFKTRIFWKSAQGGSKGNFSKIAQKVALVWKARKHYGANGIILYLVCTWSAKTGKNFGAESWSKSAELLSYSNSHKVTQNPLFLKKCKGGTKENFSKITQKVALPSKTQQHSGANGIIL